MMTAILALVVREVFAFMKFRNGAKSTDMEKALTMLNEINNRLIILDKTVGK